MTREPAQLGVFDPTTHQIFHPRKPKYVTDEIEIIACRFYRKESYAPVAI